MPRTSGLPPGRRNRSRTRAGIDHTSSETARLLPIVEMVAARPARGVPVLGDGAHAPGAIALDIAAIGADWYVANLHKWAFAPRGCGVRYRHMVEEAW